MVSGDRPRRCPLLACEDRNGDMAHRAQGLRRDCYAAVDIGASSGRVVVGFVEDGLIRLEEVLSELQEPNVANDQNRFRKQFQILIHAFDLINADFLILRKNSVCTSFHPQDQILIFCVFFQ